MIKKSFVGREQELAELGKAIADPEGKLILFVGGEGRGKSAVLEELNRRLAKTSGEQQRFCLLYGLNANDSSEKFLPALASDLLNIGGLTKRKLVLGAPGRAEQWKALVGAAPKVGELLKALVGEDQRPARERFHDFLQAVAARLQEDQRLVLIFDPDEYLDASNATDWGSLAPYLPERVSIIFAQRLEDCLAKSELLLKVKECRRAPNSPLEYLSRKNSDQIIFEQWAQRPKWIGFFASPPPAISNLFWEKYRGWALPLIMAIEELPQNPDSYSELLKAAEQLPRNFQELLRLRYDNALALESNADLLLNGLAILGRPVSCGRMAKLYTGLTLLRQNAPFGTATPCICPAFAVRPVQKG